MKIVIGATIVLAGVLGGLYVGGWLMFVQPILDVCHSFDAGTLTGAMIGIAVIKCVFAAAVGGIIAYLGTFIGSVIIGVKKKDVKKK